MTFHTETPKFSNSVKHQKYSSKLENKSEIGSYLEKLLFQSILAVVCLSSQHKAGCMARELRVILTVT